ncbi:MAG: hypothetical protein QM820_40590 [Minicystis sp.]
MRLRALLALSEMTETEVLDLAGNIGKLAPTSALATANPPVASGAAAITAKAAAYAAARKKANEMATQATDASAAADTALEALNAEITAFVGVVLNVAKTPGDLTSVALVPRDKPVVPTTAPAVPDAFVITKPRFQKGVADISVSEPAGTHGRYYAESSPDPMGTWTRLPGTGRSRRVTGASGTKISGPLRAGAGPARERVVRARARGHPVTEAAPGRGPWRHGLLTGLPPFRLRLHDPRGLRTGGHARVRIRRILVQLRCPLERAGRHRAGHLRYLLPQPRLTWVREQILQALARVPRYRDLVEHALEDPHGRVRGVAVRALAPGLSSGLPGVTNDRALRYFAIGPPGAFAWQPSQRFSASGAMRSEKRTGPGGDAAARHNHAARRIRRATRPAIERLRRTFECPMARRGFMASATLASCRRVP